MINEGCTCKDRDAVSSCQAIECALHSPAVFRRALALTGKTQRCLNLGSYNYLGFANQDPYCTPHVLEALDTYGWAACSPRAEAGRLASALQ